jgi:hypothetical protein
MRSAGAQQVARDELRLLPVLGLEQIKHRPSPFPPNPDFVADPQASAKPPEPSTLRALPDSEHALERVARHAQSGFLNQL